MFRQPANVPTEFVESLDDPRLGIPEPELAQVVAALLTRLVFDNQDRGGAHTARLGQFLRLYGAVEVRNGGQLVEAPVTNLADVYVPHAVTVRKRLGVSYEEDRDLWEDLEADSGPVFACADLARLQHQVPLCMWPVVAAAVMDGPAIYERRVARLLITERNRQVAPTRRRPSGGFVSQGQLSGVRDQALQLMRYIGDHAWRENHPAARFLEAWRTELPRLKKVQSKAATGTVTDTSPPPWHQVRALIARLDSEIRGALRVATLEEELDAIENGPPALIKGLYRRARDRATLVVLTLLGPRMAEFERFHFSSFNPVYRHSEGISPAVFIEHTKTSEPAAWHPMPAEAGLVLESYLAVVRRQSQREHAPTEPLFMAYPNTKRTRCTKKSIESRFGGGIDRDALLPIDPAEPRTGYRPHTLRKVLKQWCSSEEAAQWCLEHRVDPARREVIGEAALAHNIDNIANLYRDDTSVEGKERLRYWAACIGWEMLTGPLGARKIPDVDAYRFALREIDSGEAELRRIESEVETMCSEAERTGREVSPVAVLGRMQRTARLARELVDAKVVALEIERGSLDRMKVIPDDVPDEEVPDVDLKVIRAEEADGLSPHQLRRLRPVRNWITPDELAGLLGKGASTVRGWLTKGLPTAENIWDHAAPPIIAFNTRRRAILAEGLTDAAINTHERRIALKELLAQEPPAGWNHLPLMAAATKPA